MKIIAALCAFLVLAGCEPVSEPLHFVACVTPDGHEVRTKTLNLWIYEDGGWNGYTYEGPAPVTRVVAVYVPVQGSVCSVQEVRQ